VPHWCGMMSRVGRFGEASAEMVAKDEARRIATKVAKLPELMRKPKLLVGYVK